MSDKKSKPQRIGTGGIGSKKHGRSGRVHDSHHFTGKRGSGTKRKHETTRKQRRKKRGTHVNKYKDKKIKEEKNE